MTNPRHIVNRLKLWKRKRALVLSQSDRSFLAGEIDKVFGDGGDAIPTIVISYNNAVYVQNCVNQLLSYGVRPIVIDNASNDSDSLSILKELNVPVAYMNRNYGHLVGFLEPIFQRLPSVFAYTDPDLQFNNNLPVDFLDCLAQLTTEFGVFKAGFALSLDGRGKIISNTVSITRTKPFSFEKEVSLVEHEKKFWRFRIQHQEFEIYAAPIDTTFAVYRKQNYAGNFADSIRVAGNYSAIHLPWFPEMELFSHKQKMIYKKGNVSKMNWAVRK